MSEARPSLRAVLNQQAAHDQSAPSPAVAPEGGGGDNGGMDDLIKRVGKLEGDVTKIREDVGEIKGKLPSLATEASMHKEFNLQSWRVFGALAALGAALAGIMAKGFHWF